MTSAEAIPTQRIALVLQYLGTHFHGWQRQPHQRTVQEELEGVMFRHFHRHVGVYAAGRVWQPNLFVLHFAFHYYYAPLDESLIQAALNQLLGRSHLAAFHRAGSQRQHSWVEVQVARCDRTGPFLHIEVQANGFLYGMMRLLVGMLVQVGRGERTLSNFQQIWTNERREEVKYAAPAHGLCLLRVGYPESPFAPEVWWHDTMPQFLLNPLAGADCPGVEEGKPSTANQESSISAIVN